MGNLLKTSVLSVVLTLMSVAAYGNAAVVSAKLDSTVLLMGKQTALHIEILQAKNVEGAFTNESSDTICKYVEIVGRTDADTVDVGNDRVQIKRDLILQSFDSGLYVLPPIQYVVGKDTFKSQQLTLKVMPVNVDTLVTIHGSDKESVLMYDWRWLFIFDYLPDFIVDYWWVFLIIIVIAAGGIYVFMFRKKKGADPTVVVKLVPPYDEAMQRLEELKTRKLWQNGQEKEYYTILTDILRNYIDRRFGINAMEMTSSQIISILRKNKETKAVNEQLSQILEMADFVKFAKVRPLPDDNEAAYVKAVNFVAETKPLPPQIGNETEGKQQEGENAKNDTGKGGDKK